MCSNAINKIKVLINTKFGVAVIKEGGVCNW